MADRVFARLPLPVAPGDIVALDNTDRRWRVETAKIADDHQDAKCVLVKITEPPNPPAWPNPRRRPPDQAA